MNGYVCLYGKTRLEVHANTTYEARCKAVEHLKIPKSKVHMISVILAEKDNAKVTHIADF